MVDYSESTISNIENDAQPPTLYQMEDLANALGINIMQLFSEPKVINNTFNDSPNSTSNIIETQQNYSNNDMLDMMLTRLDKKDAQMENFITTYQINMEQLIKEMIKQRD